MEEEAVNKMQEARVTQRELLERGITVFRQILNQKVSVTRDEMCDLLNFEVTVNAFIANMKMVEGKTPEELMELAKNSIQPSV